MGAGMSWSKWLSSLSGGKTSNKQLVMKRHLFSSFSSFSKAKAYGWDMQNFCDAIHDAIYMFICYIDILIDIQISFSDQIHGLIWQVVVFLKKWLRKRPDCSNSNRKPLLYIKTVILSYLKCLFKDIKFWFMCNMSNASEGCLKYFLIMSVWCIT